MPPTGQQSGDKGVNPTFPSFPRFLWLFWMQPILLHRLLRARDVDGDGRWFALWHGNAAERMYVRYSLLMLVVMMPAVVLAAGAVLDIDRVGVAGGMAFLFCIFRIPVFVLELIWLSLCRTIEQLSGYSTLPWCPVHFHDLSHLPLPGLRAQLLSPHADPKMVDEVLAACARAPGQQHIARDVLAALQARELRDLLTTGQLQAVTELRGHWLPGAATSQTRLVQWRNVAAALLAASTALSHHHRLQQVEQAQHGLNTLHIALLTDNNFEDSEHQRTLEVAQTLTTAMHKEAQTRAAEQLPNPFRPDGNPLDPEFGAETFRGREETVRQIELLLGREQAAAIALLGPRRMGKTSLLRMLPVMLPNTLCVFLDLQHHTLRQPLDLFTALGHCTRDHAQATGRSPPPALTGDTLQDARAWLDKLEHRPSGERILFCLDEFERLEDLLDEQPQTRLQLTQMMALLRATIQHRRRVRLLIAGVATFDELGTLWTDTFISAQEVRLGPLAPDVAQALIRQPLPEAEGFSDTTVSEAIAHAVIARTGGQPYLTQLFGYWLIDTLNQNQRRTALTQDIDLVEELICDKAGGFFRESLNPRGAGFNVRAAMASIVAEEGTVALSGRQKRFLIRRGLLTQGATLAFPILARWLRDFA